MTTTAFLILVSTLLQPPRWPAPETLDHVFRVSEPHRAVLRTVLQDEGRRPLYLFVCRTADDESVPGVVYAGDLDCRLMPADLGEVEENLLVEAPDLSAWYSRGRMFARELLNACAEYPQYGLRRTFRLRGMSLSLTFENVRFAGPTLMSYDLRLSVRPDPTALSPIAESSGYLDPHRAVPGRSCANLQKGVEWPLK